jgi:hypothetical protein
MKFNETEIKSIAIQIKYNNPSMKFDIASIACGARYQYQEDMKVILPVLKYCEPHLDQMWAASIVGMLLNCDFRDSQIKLKDFLERK